MSLSRKILLAASTSAWLRERAARTKFVVRSVSRFMPGERLEDALEAAVDLKQDGIGAILTQLGENLTTAEASEAVTRHYLEVLDRIGLAQLDAQISVKPTQLGLDLDRELCLRQLRQLVDRAATRRQFTWLDMENARYVDATLDLYRGARERTPRVGLALQAYLYRTERDVESLLPHGAAIRLVKGAYLESVDAAFPRRSDVDENFYRLACRILDEHAQHPDTLLHIATHDSRLIEKLAAYIADRRIPASAYEFAMLFGIQAPLQRRLVESGRRLRVLISYGEHWFPWYMRRLAERPANLWFVARNLFTG